MTALSWNDFKLIKAIADAKGMAGAAALLKVNHSTVFRQLSQVEKTLGTPLFERRRAGYLPTIAGMEMIALAERMDEDILGFTRKMAGHDQTPSGELRVTTNNDIFNQLLISVIPEYVARYPLVRLEIVQTNLAASLSRRDADIAIRATDTPPESLIGRRISALGWAIYGHTSDFGTRQPPPDMEELRDQYWIGLGGNLAESKPARYLTENVRADRIILRLNTVFSLGEAVRARIGIAPLPCYLGDACPDLVRLSPLVPQLESSLWLLTHADLRQAARVRSFMDFVGAYLVRRKGDIEGRACSEP